MLLARLTVEFVCFLNCLDVFTNIIILIFLSFTHGARQAQLVILICFGTVLQHLLHGNSQKYHRKMNKLK